MSDDDTPTADRDTTTEHAMTDDSGGDADDAGRELLWSEYSYRHEHIWKVVFQFTVAVVALSAVPYLPRESGGRVIGLDSDTLARLALLPPVVAVLLGVLALLRLHREFRRFDEVKGLYLKDRDQTSTFARDVYGYVGLLCVGSVMHTAFLFCHAFG